MRLFISHINALQTVDVPDSHEVDEDVDGGGDEDDGLVICFVAMLYSSDNLQTIVPSYFGVVNLTLEGRIW